MVSSVFHSHGAPALPFVVDADVLAPAVETDALAPAADTDASDKAPAVDTREDTVDPTNDPDAAPASGAGANSMKRGRSSSCTLKYLTTVPSS